MKIKHIRSMNLWLLSKGKQVLYRGRLNPWDYPEVIAIALRRSDKLSGVVRLV